MTWAFRAVALIGAPLLTYFQISRDVKGIAVGLGVAALVIAIEAMMERVQLLTIIVGLLGAFMGLLLAKFADYGVTQMDNENIVKFWQRYVLLVQTGLAWLGMVIMIQKFPEFGDLDKDILAAGRKRGGELKVLD